VDPDVSWDADAQVFRPAGQIPLPGLAVKHPQFPVPAQGESIFPVTF